MRQLLRDRNAFLCLSGQLVSAFGDNALWLAMGIWVKLLTGSSSLAGLTFFVFMLAVNSPWAWRSARPAVHWARLASVVVGIVFVLYLVWAELFRINAICLYCTGVHVLTFLLFALIVGRVTFSGVRPATDSR